MEKLIRISAKNGYKAWTEGNHVVIEIPQKDATLTARVRCYNDLIRIGIVQR